jgi:hypothetical protein
MAKPVDALGWGPRYDVTHGPDGLYYVKVTPNRLTGIMRTSTVCLTPDQFARFMEWRAGRGLIQSLMHDLGSDLRKKLMDGY